MMPPAELQLPFHYPRAISLRRYGGNNVGRRWGPLACVAAVVLAGCAVNHGTPSASKRSGPAAHEVVARVPSAAMTYVALASDTADLIHWTTTGQRFSGSLSLTSIESNPPDEWLSKSSEPVTGRFNGSHIRLHMPGEPTQTGTVSGTAFTVRVLGPGGALVPSTFSLGSATQFAQASSHLSATVAVVNQAAALRAELPGLKAPFDPSMYLQAFPDDVAQMDLLESDSLVNQFDSTVSSSACEALEYNNGGLSSQEEEATQMSTSSAGLAAAIGATRSLMATVTSNLQQLQTDETAAGFTPAGAPSSAQVTSAIDGAQQLIVSAVAQANGYIAQADSDLATVTQYVFSASQLNGCGLTVNAPTMVSQLS
jgi:hypothetical protein